jgi:TPR repeat protein
MRRRGDGVNRRRSSNGESLYNHSLHCLIGRYMPKDPRQSFLLNSQAAESGNHDAVLAMGWFYHNGVGVGPDMNLAKRWYKKSARQGEPLAMFSTGQLANDQREYADAMVWFKRAAEKGNARSLFWIGKLFWKGHGVRADRKQAMTFFRKAAAQKVPAARRTLKFLSRNASLSRR